MTLLSRQRGDVSPADGRVDELGPDAPAPFPLLPGRTVSVPGRGEFFVRDSGGSGPVVLLLHGWMFSADLNWAPVYAPLTDAGWRVLAIDHRGHGRGLRSPRPFRLADCADDAAGVVEALGCGPVVAVGYSMGGPIAQLLAHRHPAQVRSLVLCATAADWGELRLKLFWRSMGLVRLALGLVPDQIWPAILRSLSVNPAEARWAAAELSRGSGRDLAEAGRELGRFDSSPWLADLTCPTSVVVTTKDRAVPPRKQRVLARTLHAPVHEVAADHGAVSANASEFLAALHAALASVAPGEPRQIAERSA